MRPALSGREHITLRLDGPRANQHIPVRGAGHGGKGRRRGNQFRTGRTQLAVQLREAQVITDRQANPAHRRISHYHSTAISIVIGFAITAAIVRDIDIEQMQLVVARHRFALIIDQQRAGMRLGRRLVHRRQRQRAGHNP
ncbi:hypothetical protein D3C86_1704020 [compost metagenome]